ncbi:MAG: hypothetical protein SNJ59_12690 [Aggregatilineales bacterium]
MRLHRFFSLLGLCAAALLPILGTARAQDDAQPGRIDFTLQTGGTVIAQVNDAPWLIAPTDARSAADFFFDLHIFSVIERRDNSFTLRDIPIDLETRTYSVAPTRGPADLYVTTQFGATLVSPSGTFTVETIDFDTETFSGTFTLTREDVTLSGTVTNLPLVPIKECRTSGPNGSHEAGESAFTFTVLGSETVPSAAVPFETGAWIVEVNDNWITNAPLTYNITLQDTLDGEGLRLELSLIPFEDLNDTVSANTNRPGYILGALVNRAAFQLTLVDDGAMALEERDRRLSGQFDLLARDRTMSIVLISGSFHNLPLPARSCVIRHLTAGQN